MTSGSRGAGAGDADGIDGIDRVDGIDGIDGGSNLDVVRLGAIDDHPAILEGVLYGVRDRLPRARFAVLARTVEAFEQAGVEVDLVLLDVVLDDDTDVGANVTRLARAGLPVLLYTQETRHPPIARAFRAGALGIVGKHESLETLAEAILTAMRGEPVLNAEWASVIDGESVPDLAPRESEALTLYATGLPLKSVARRMGLSQETVKEYLVRARGKYAKSGRPAHTKTDLYIRAVEDGYLPPPHTP